MKKAEIIFEKIKIMNGGVLPKVCIGCDGDCAHCSVGRKALERGAFPIYSTTTAVVQQEFSDIEFSRG